MSAQTLKEQLRSTMKVLDLNVVRRLQLLEEATWIIIQYLKEVHPIAVLIKALRFSRTPQHPMPRWPTLRLVRVHASLDVRGRSLHIKRPSTRVGDIMISFRYRDGEALPYDTSMSDCEEPMFSSGSERSFGDSDEGSEEESEEEA